MLTHTAPRFTEHKPLHRQNLPGAGHYDQDQATAFGSPEPERVSPVELVPSKKLPKAPRPEVFPLRRGDGVDEGAYPGPGKYFPNLIVPVRVVCVYISHV